MKIETVKIIAKNETGFVVINASDFDAKKDKIYVDKPGHQKIEKTVKAKKADIKNKSTQRDDFKDI